MIEPPTIVTSATQDRHEPSMEKLPGHWVLAKLGKRVLRPGGLELTQQIQEALAITTDDDVVEFAPGLGITAKMTLARQPKSYTAVERDDAAAATVRSILAGLKQSCVVGSAEASGLPSGAASVVYGEAMLSMHMATTKARIVAEAARLLRPGGRYGIHELCIIPDAIDDETREAIARDLSGDIHAGIRPLTEREWCELLSDSGLRVIAQFNAPMHLLEARRIVADEGLLSAVRFAWNALWNRAGRRRVLGMRKSFRKHQKHLAAIALIATKPG